MTGGTAVLLKTGYPNYGSETKFPLHLYLYYKIVSQNKATAVTTMSLGMYFVCPDKWYVGPWSDYGSYLGTTANTFSKSVPSNFSGTLWLAENVTFNVQHDAQGKGTAKIAWKWGVDSSYGQFESPSGTYSVSLPDIPRTSSVSVGGAVNAGSSLTINIGRASSSFTHNLRYAFGSASGTIATGVGTSYNWSVPYELLSQIPSATSGVGTIYCDTYYSGTAIGTSSCVFTVNAPNNDATKPAASMMLSPYGSVPSAFSGMYIRGKTAVKADFTAEPKYGTSIKSYALSVNGKTTTGDPATSAVLSTSGTISATGTVTDARGFSRVLSQNITVHAYDSPSVAPGAGQNAVICERSDANGITSPSGTYLRVIAKRRYSSVDGINKCALRYRVKLSSASGYGSWVTLLADGTTEDEYSGTISDVVPSVTTSYDVQIGVVDTMGTEAAITFHIPTDEVTFHIREGGRGAAFFGYSEKDGELSLSGKRISNVGTPSEAGDALPKGSLLDLVYPVNSIYLSFSHTSPASLFGGTWTRIENQFLWAADANGVIGNVGGESTHTLTVNEMPSHYHDGITTDGLLNTHRMIYRNGVPPASGNGAYWSIQNTTSPDSTGARTVQTGGGAAHNNMPPYIQVSAWRRTA